MPLLLAFLRKYVLWLFWMVLALHCIFQYFESICVAITKPMLVPMLMTYLLVRDNNIGQSAGKFVFYVGLFLALFGDVLLIAINDTFFLSGMIIFMAMNICYAISFLCLKGFEWRKPGIPLVVAAALFCVGYALLHFLDKDLGDYRMPIIVYMVTVSLMIVAAFNLLTDAGLRPVAIRYFIPGAVIFLEENLLVALNKFHFDSNKYLFIVVMITYAAAQYLFTLGIRKTYLGMRKQPGDKIKIPASK